MSKSLEELKNYKLRELSSGFDQNNNINVFSKWSYEEGWKDAIKAVSEREKKLVEALKTAISYQEKAKSFISHFDDCNALIDEELEEPCECGADTFSHDNYIAICLANEALKEHGG